MYPDYNLLDNLPIPHDLMPALTVSAKGNAYLSQDLISRLRLRGGQPIDVLPPNSERTPYWHLDLRPNARRNIDWYPDTRPRIRGLLLPDGLLREGELLTLRLVPGEPAFLGFYPLLPAGPPVARPKRPRQGVGGVNP
jgi:hypothetical protein